MSKQYSAKGLTRIEMLVLAVVCLLLIVLVPLLLARPRERASRVLCGANLGQIGKLMLIYANDYEDALPHPGSPTTTWGPVKQFMALDRYDAYGVNRATNSGGTASISSCFYLLVKYYQAPPRLFVCKGDVGTSEFKLSRLPPGTVAQTCQLTNLWDFGPLLSAKDNPARYCSYSYHAPFGLHPLTTARDPNLAVAADRNPWIKSPGADAKPFAAFKPEIWPYFGRAEMARQGNALTHRDDGQNVLFLDGRVGFEARAYCGVRKDNIYTVSARGPERGDPYGVQPLPTSQALAEEDSVLLHDDMVYYYGTASQGRSK